MNTKSFDLIVIGGGAAGFFGAITCALERPTSRILVLEKNKQPLAKVLLSGGGRCNLSNACFDPAELVKNYPRGGHALRGAFSRFQPQDTIQWFEQRGVPLKIEGDGRIFPASDRAKTVVDCLLVEARRLRVEVRCETAVTSLLLHTHLEPSEEQDQACADFNGQPHFHLITGKEESLLAGSVLIATGGTSKSFALAAQMGHRILPPVPSLFSFEIHDPRLEGLSGISIPDVELHLPEFKLDQRGALLITHWGLSGPAALRLSAWGARQLKDCNYHTPLVINWLPTRNLENMQPRLWGFRQAHLRSQVSAHEPTGRLPMRLWQQLAQHCGTPEHQSWTECSHKQVQRLAEELTRGEFAITGKGEFKEEFVTCGGVALDEVNFKTMESKLIPGLYFAGEVLDVDGITGGFNLQAAWTTGYLAGRAVADKINSVN
jgi:predicted Rossmann fold flavoprotein